MMKFLAQATDPIGMISPPANIPSAIDSSGKLIGIIAFMNILLRIVFIVAGLFAFLNIVLAGFGFLSAGGDPKMVARAWEKIYQSLLGIVIIVISFLFAAIIGILVFKDPTAILQPKIIR
jgi:hypothetical protein